MVQPLKKKAAKRRGRPPRLAVEEAMIAHRALDESLQRLHAAKLALGRALGVSGWSTEPCRTDLETGVYNRLSAWADEYLAEADGIEAQLSRWIQAHNEPGEDDR